MRKIQFNLKNYIVLFIEIYWLRYGQYKFTYSPTKDGKSIPYMVDIAFFKPGHYDQEHIENKLYLIVMIQIRFSPC